MIDLAFLISAAADGIENVITDPYGTFKSAFGGFAPIVVLAIFMTGIAMVYIKTQSFVPSLVMFTIGSMTLATLLPAHDIIQKLMFLLTAVGVTAMFFYAFAKRGGRMRRQVKKEFVPLLGMLVRGKAVQIEDPKLARGLGKELRRLGIRENVLIGRDDTYGKTIAALISVRGKRKKNAWFEFESLTG